MSLLLGLIYLRLDYNQEGVQNINGVIFLILVSSSLGNMFTVLHSLTKG